MPPSPKFTREQIVEAALELVREKGIEALTAREVGHRLGCSAMPVFTAFGDMQELRTEVHRVASRRMDDFIATGRKHAPLFKHMGMQSIRFARQEPYLFQMMNMPEFVKGGSVEEVWARMGVNQTAIAEGVARTYGLTTEEGLELFRHVWTYTYGIAVMCATGVCQFPDEELEQMLSLVFNATLNYIRSGGLNGPNPAPRPIEPTQQP